jgi:hypothetical protein
MLFKLRPLSLWLQLTSLQLMAIKMKGVECKDETKIDNMDKSSNAWKLYTNDVICEGVAKGGEYPICLAWGDSRAGSVMVSRCRMAQADSVFMIFTAVLVAGATWLGWMRLKREY